MDIYTPPQRCPLLWPFPDYIPDLFCEYSIPEPLDHYPNRMSWKGELEPFHLSYPGQGEQNIRLINPLYLSRPVFHYMNPAIITYYEPTYLHVPIHAITPFLIGVTNHINGSNPHHPIPGQNNLYTPLIDHGNVQRIMIIPLPSPAHGHNRPGRSSVLYPDQSRPHDL